jgi:hypothetical protein
MATMVIVVEASKYQQPTIQRQLHEQEATYAEEGHHAKQQPMGE